MREEGELAEDEARSGLSNTPNLYELYREVGQLKIEVAALKNWKERMDYRATRILVIGIGSGFAFAGSVVAGILLNGIGVGP